MEKNSNTRISGAVIRRLPKYRRYLEELLNKNIYRISSKDLSRMIGFSASQIRQDLNNFGGFGQQGYGYSVKELYEQIGKILGLDRPYNVIIIGTGNLGQAIANYTHFYRTGFIIKAMFDINPRLIGLRMNDVEVRDSETIEEYLKDNEIDFAVICTNKESAQDIVKTLIDGEVKGIWNFAPLDLDVPDHIILENVHLSDSLHALIYFFNHPEDY